MIKKEFSEFCQRQKEFVDKELLVQWLMGIYEEDIDLPSPKPTKFQVFIDKSVIKHFHLDSDTPEYVLEGISELVYAIESGVKTDLNGKKLKRIKYIGLKGVGGVFDMISFVSKKDRMTVLKMHYYVKLGDMATRFPK